MRIVEEGCRGSDYQRENLWLKILPLVYFKRLRQTRTTSSTQAHFFLLILLNPYINLMASASTAVAGPSRPQVRPPVVHPGSGNAIIINPCQVRLRAISWPHNYLPILCICKRLNPILDSIRNVSKEFGDIVPDFQLGRTTCALFLRSVRTRCPRMKKLYSYCLSLAA